MAKIDVSEVLRDPMFKDQFQFHKIRVSTGHDGLPMRKESRRVAEGVVTSLYTEFTLTPDATVPSGSIQIHTSDYKLRGDIQANRDEVTWHSKRYVVAEVRDCSHFGRGFYALICHPLEFGDECKCY